MHETGSTYSEESLYFLMCAVTLSTFPRERSQYDGKVGVSQPAYVRAAKTTCSLIVLHIYVRQPRYTRGSTGLSGRVRKIY